MKESKLKTKNVCVSEYCTHSLVWAPVCVFLHKTEIFKVASVTQDQRLCGKREKNRGEEEVERGERTVKCRDK